MSVADSGVVAGSACDRAWKLLRSGQLQAAEQAFRALLSDDRGSSEVWKGIGVVAYQAKRYEEAEPALRTALRIDPRLAEVKHYLASTVRTLGRIDEALKLFGELSEALADDPLFLNNWGNALVAAGRPADGVGVIERALAMRPEADLFRSNLARALIACRRGQEAVDLLIAAPGDWRRIELATVLGNALLSLGRYQEAASELQRVHDAGLANSDDLHNLGTALQFLGRVEEAQAAYREAIAKNPKAALSQRQLASVVKFKGSEQELVELRAALQRPDLTPAERAEIHLGLAKALDDLGQYGQAFANLEAGNQLIRSRLNYSAAANSAYIDRSIETFSRDFLSARRPWGSPSARPIFIVGMPRSGTTLVEQILCSHPEVHGAGELMTIVEAFRNLRRTLVPDLGMPQIASLITEDATLRSAEFYLDNLARLDSTTFYVTDKMPFNFRYLGFISLLFPNARIIHITRHPLDVGLSCFFVRFNDQMHFSFNLAEIGNYYRDYQRLMAHWIKVVENPILTVDYDHLVHFQEDETRRILQFCELDWDDRCLEFHRTERAVLTASNWQVRQPLYSTSVGRWRHYREWLRPMMTTMGLTDPDGWSAADWTRRRPALARARPTK